MHRMAAQNPVWVVTAWHQDEEKLNGLNKNATWQADRCLLGPGDPELITAAWAALQSGARWLYPVKKAEESSPTLCPSSPAAASPCRTTQSNWSFR